MARGELEANAHLIAAAPDLLEALEDVREKLQFALEEAQDGRCPRQPVFTAIAFAKTAIARAKGEG
jgi:hypothetical protein